LFPQLTAVKFVDYELVEPIDQLSWSVFLMDSGMAVFFHAEKIEGVVKPTA
jgi:hypothetical protein